jgi:hypothetical protein
MKKSRKKSLQEMQDALIKEALTYGPGSPEHEKAVAQIATLDSVGRRKTPWISLDSIVTSAAALLITGLVILAERDRPITGKAFGLIRTPKS